MADNKKAVCGGFLVGDGLEFEGKTLKTTGTGGTEDYTELENKPSINSVELNGNKTLEDLGIASKNDFDETVTTLEETIDDIVDDIETIDTTLQQHTDKIAVNSSRIDTFTHLSEGSTTGDAELADIRVGYDGKTYNSAGSAVREQVSGLKQDLTNETARATARENEIEELFTMPTQQAVDDWLNRHPEATTTVTDGSVTEQKLGLALRGKLWQGWSLKNSSKNNYDVVSIESPTTYQNNSVYNVKLTFPIDKLSIGDDMTFTNCEFYCNNVGVGTTSAIEVIGKNIEFIGCKFYGVSGSTTGIRIKPTGYNIHFTDCYFSNNFKNLVNCGSSKNITFSGCYFEALSGSDTNIYQIKLTNDVEYIGTEYSPATQFVKIVNCFFEGNGTDYKTSIDTYTGGHDVIVSDCIFFKTKGITIKTDWRDLSGEDPGGTSINGIRYPHDINVHGCLFFECEHCFYFGNTQYSESNIGETLINNVFVNDCTMIGGSNTPFSSTEGISSAYPSYIEVKNCRVYDNVFGRVASKDVVIDGLYCVAITNTGKVSGMIQIGHTRDTEVKCHSFTLRNSTILVKSGETLSVIYCLGRVDSINLDNNIFESNYTAIIRNTSNGSCDFLSVNGCRNNKPLMVFPANYNKVVAMNCFHEGYVLSRQSGSTGYGSSKFFAMNCFCIGVDKAINPANASTGYVYEDHAFNCVCLNS